MRHLSLDTHLNRRVEFPIPFKRKGLSRPVKRISHGQPSDEPLTNTWTLSAKVILTMWFKLSTIPSYSPYSFFLDETWRCSTRVGKPRSRLFIRKHILGSVKVIVFRPRQGRALSRPGLFGLQIGIHRPESPCSIRAQYDHHKARSDCRAVRGWNPPSCGPWVEACIGHLCCQRASECYRTAWTESLEKPSAAHRPKG